MNENQPDLGVLDAHRPIHAVNRERREDIPVAESGVVHFLRRVQDGRRRLKFGHDGVGLRRHQWLPSWFRAAQRMVRVGLRRHALDFRDGNQRHVTQEQKEEA